MPFYATQIRLYTWGLRGARYAPSEPFSKYRRRKLARLADTKHKRLAARRILAASVTTSSTESPCDQE